MRILRLPLLLMTLLVFISCSQEGPSSTTGQTEQESDTSDINSRTAESSLDLACEPDAEVLEENRLLIRELGLGVFIAADSTTYDEGLGQSHRLLIAMDLSNCEEVDRRLLPVNVSPDFPYYLADISYHRTRGVVAVKGLKTVLCYDLKSKTVFGPVGPEYKSKRELADAQSGNIQRLEIWEEYIIGYATDLGPFSFTIEADNSLKPYLPAVEFPDFGALFLVPTTDDRVQAIIPSMEDQPPYGFAIETLFEQPMELEGEPLALPPYYALLGQTANGKHVVVNIRNKKRMELPDNLNQASVDQVKNWLEEQF